jgi:hypothetical protein
MGSAKRYGTRERDGALPRSHVEDFFLTHDTYSCYAADADDTASIGDSMLSARRISRFVAGAGTFAGVRADDLQ